MSDQTYYAAAIQAEFISMVRADLRDSSSDALGPFWKGSPNPGTDEVAQRYEAATDYRTLHNLSRMSEGDFIGQVLPDKAKTIFGNFVDAMGIEKEYVEDLFLEAPTKTPDVPGLTETIRVLIDKGYVVDNAALEETYPSVDLSEDPVYHIDEPLPSLFGEEDSIVAGKMARGRTYTSLYVEKSR